jgi:hypothetical protein
MSDIIEIQNNSAIPFMIEDLGILIEEKEDVSDIDHQELCESSHLISAITNNILTIIVNEISLSVEQAKKYLEIDSVLEDAMNERWYCIMNTTIEPFTQLRITGRPFVLDGGVDLTLEEGSDLIID